MRFYFVRLGVSVGDNSAMLGNMIGMDAPDTPIYRTFRFRHFRDALQRQSIALVAPALWDDPFENFLTGCAITYRHEGKWRQKFFDSVRKPVYAQCWSLASESDALWRIYSSVVKHPETGRNASVEDEGVKVRTTARKLLGALCGGSPIRPENACFLGQVEYMPQEQAVQRVASEVGREQLNAFAGGLGHARSLLIKREPFQYECEVRLVFVEHREASSNNHLFFISIDPNELFEEIVLDPRLHSEDVRGRVAELRLLGFNGPIVKSELYQKVLYEIVLQ